MSINNVAETADGLVIRHLWANIQRPAFILTASAIGGAMLLLMLQAQAVWSTISLARWALWPLFVSLGLAALTPRRLGQVALMIGALLYAGWFTFVYLEVFYFNIDAQGPIVFLFMGFYSLPVMVPIWVVAVVAMVFPARGRKKFTAAA